MSKRSWTDDGDDDEASPRPKRLALPSELTNESICDRCSAIKWAELAAKSPVSKSGKMVLTLSDSHSSLRQSACRVCQLLALIKPPSLDDQPCHLKAFSSMLSFVGHHRLLLKPSPFSDCTVLYAMHEDRAIGDHAGRSGWHESGCLALIDDSRGDITRYDFGPREIRPHTINYSLIREWMTHCTTKHRSACSSPTNETLAGFRVIDCRSSLVIEAPPRCEYVALSYVWGSSVPACVGRAGNGFSSGVEFPAIIADALSVTISLGFRYLWVDQYVSFHFF
jgi:hypothetical protein